jgi:hypothetical protein
MQAQLCLDQISQPRIHQPSPHHLKTLHSRPRNSVAVQVVVDVNQHTRISPLVERRRAGAARSLRSTPTDHEVDTLWVVLSAVVAPGSMQRDDLMPQYIRTRFQRTRNRHRPRIVVSDKIIRTPSAWRRTAFETKLVDFGEFESGLVDGRTIVVRARS